MTKIIRTRIWEAQGGAGGGAGGGGGDASFNGQRAITRNTPGLIGVNPDAQTVIEMLENVFYPPVAPICALSVNDPIREIGSTADYTLTWAVTKQNNVVTGITVDGTAKTPTGDSQSGTQSGTLDNVIGTFTKTMTATDGTLSSTASATVTYLARRFWGTTSKSGVNGNDILDSDILALSGSDLVNERNLSLTNFGGGGKRLIFAMPSSLGTPQFIINGLVNTAFTLVRGAGLMTNAHGYPILMDVWVSDNLYNSPLDTVTVN